MLSRLSRVSGSCRRVSVRRVANCDAVIARNALAQEESQDFNPDFPETIPINIGEQNQGCSC
jgi:hypothetical protein